MSGFVYFIGASDTSETWIKIGFTAGNVYSRCGALQTGCPFPLSVLAFAPGSPDDEKFLHERFAAFRGYGEWFVMEGFLQAYVADLIKSSTPMQPAPTLWTDVYRMEHGA